MRHPFPVILFIIFFFFIENSYGQCSMCRAVLESEEGQETAKGINKGILYLMAIPYLLVGVVGWKVFQILKK
jgi:Na+/H+ antiporter NhaC